MVMKNRRNSTKREKNFRLFSGFLREMLKKCKKYYAKSGEAGKNMKAVRNFTKSVRNNHRSGAFYNVKYHCVIS